MPPLLDLAVSAVIPVKDRPADLRNILAALLRQTLPPAEIVVVDQSESNACADAARQVYAEHGPAGLPPLIYVHDPSIDGLTAARNEGLRRGAAPLVAYFDDDAVPVPDTLLVLATALQQRPELVGAGGIITNYSPPPAPAYWLSRIFRRGPFWDERQPIYWNWSRYASGEIAPSAKLNGGCMVIRREALLAIKGFDSRYRGSSVGEDIEVSQRLAARGGARSLALVGGAFLEHRSRGGWKAVDRSLEFQVVSSHYLFRSDPARTRLNGLRLCWLLAGLLLLAAVSSFRRRHAGPLRSFAAGVRCIAADYAGCPFLRST